MKLCDFCRDVKRSHPSTLRGRSARKTRGVLAMKRSSRRWKKRWQMRWKWQRKRLKKEKRKRKQRRARSK